MCWLNILTTFRMTLKRHLNRKVIDTLLHCLAYVQVTIQASERVDFCGVFLFHVVFFLTVGREL